MCPTRRVVQAKSLRGHGWTKEYEGTLVTPETAPTVLVVDSISSTRAATVGALSRAGYVCTSASSFADARARLADTVPDLLITAVRLGAFNGLELVLRRFLSDPLRRAIVTDTVLDPVLAREARRAGTVYVVTPVSPRDLLELVADQLRRHRGDDRRRWPRAHLGERVQIAIGEAQAELVDVSYGGWGLELTGAATERVASRVTLRLAPVPRPVHGRLAWTAPGAATDVVACGFTLVEANPSARAAWRQWVDHVSA